MKRKGAGVVVAAALLASAGLAQFPEDALRLGQPGGGVGARALGMGNAYTGVASDFSAIYWNPAGLAQLNHAEFSLGLSYQANTDKSTFFGNQQSYTNNSTKLNMLGIAHPVPVRRGSLVLAFGYTRQANFTQGMSFTGFNPTSSYIQGSAQDGQPYASDLTNNLAYQLYLANIDTVAHRFISPIKNRVTQQATVTEGGGLNNWSVAAAVDIGPDIAVGATLTYLSGGYRYDRNYVEQDLNNVYGTFPFDFDRLTLDEFIDDDVSGVNAKFGLMYRIPERFRVGITVTTPTAYYVKETFGIAARSRFDNGDIKPSDGPYMTDGASSYDVHTPWVFGAGASIIMSDLVLSGDIDFTDWSTLEFANANREVMDLNRQMKSTFRGTANYRFGAEYDVAGIGLRLRGGYVQNTSPYKNDPSEFNQQYVTGGLGILLGSSVMLDLGYAYGWRKSYRLNYDSSSRTDESITTQNFLLALVYRF